MGADQGAAAALNTGFCVPLGHMNTNSTFFPLSGCRRPAAVSRNLGNFQFLTLAFHHFGGNFLDKIRSFSRYGRGNVMAGDLFRNLDLDDIFNSTVNGCVVHFDNLIAFFAVGLLNGVLD